MQSNGKFLTTTTYSILNSKQTSIFKIEIHINKQFRSGVL